MDAEEETGAATPRLWPALVSVWWQPRAAVRQALAAGPPPVLVAGVWALGLIGSDLLDRDWAAWTLLPLPAGWPPAWLAPLALLVAGGLTLGALHGGAALLRLSGRLLGGRATRARLRVALAWGFLPDAWALLYRLPVLVLWPGLAGSRDAVRVEFAGGLLQIDWSGLEGAWLPAILAVGFLDATVQVAGLVILAKALGEANGFSAWRGLGSWLLALLAFVLAVVLIVIGGVRLLPSLAAG